MQYLKTVPNQLTWLHWWHVWRGGGGGLWAAGVGLRVAGAVGLRALLLGVARAGWLDVAGAA